VKQIHGVGQDLAGRLEHRTEHNLPVLLPELGPGSAHNVPQRAQFHLHAVMVVPYGVGAVDHAEVFL